MHVSTLFPFFPYTAPFTILDFYWNISFSLPPFHNIPSPMRLTIMKTVPSTVALVVHISNSLHQRSRYQANAESANERGSGKKDFSPIFFFRGCEKKRRDPRARLCGVLCVGGSRQVVPTEATALHSRSISIYTRAQLPVIYIDILVGDIYLR